MPYTKVHEAWEDLPSVNTPINAAALDQIEAGIATAQATAEAGGGGGGAVDSVNGATGVVVLDATDVGADPSGSAAAAQAASQPLDADLTALAAAGNSAVLAATTASFLTADETKLDGIEAGADVTDAANVEAAGAAMETAHLETAHGRSYDGFTRTASGNIGNTETHTRTWQNTTEFQTTGGRLKKLAAGYGIQYLDAHNAQGAIEAKIGAGATSEWWVICRYSNTSNYARFGVGSGGAYAAEKIEGGSVVAFDAAVTLATPPTPANGDVLQVWLWGDDGIDVYINGVHTWTIGDDLNVSSRLMGVATNGTTPEFDYWSFTPTGGPSTAVGIAVVDAGGYFTATDLEGILQEIGAALP